MSTPENPAEEKKEWSLLESIIEASKVKNQTNPETHNQESTITTPSPEAGNNTPWPTPPKKPKQPMDPMLVLKFIGALLLVGVIFFWSFLAYIVFNPAQAQFFVTMFRINPDDIAILLTQLLNGSFGILILSLSIFWIIALFRAIWTPKDLKRKRMMAWISAVMIGVLLFSTLAFWAVLFDRIGKIPWPNLDGSITISDSSLLSNPETKWDAKVSSTSNMIGPITLQFDISWNAKNIQDTNPIIIDRFEINFDGASCNGNTSRIEGKNPLQEKNITCTFDQIKSYNIQWVYHVTARSTGEKAEITIPIPAVEIRWLVDIQLQKNKDGKNIVTLNAGSLKRIGNPKWTYYPSRKTVEADSITETLTNIPNIIWLTIFPESKWVDRIFIIEDTSYTAGGGSIELVPDAANPTVYSMTLTGITIDQNSIIGIEWSLSDGSVICKWFSDVCNYNFGNYGKRTVYAKVQLANKETITLEKDVSIDEPILLARHVQVTDSKGKSLNTEDTFDAALKAYIVKNILPPETITLDARDVVTENPGYSIEGVRWIIQYGKTKEEKEWERITLPINNSVRYTIQAIYTINKNITITANDIKTATDIIIIDTERKSLMPNIIIQNASDYVPTVITVDGSQSKSENGEIKKFIYNFGEGKPDTVGDAIYEYQYNTPWEKEITLTIVNESWESASIKKILVLKEAPRTADFAPSLSPWVIQVPIDFNVIQSNGQVDQFLWNFGDNTPTQRWMSVTHTFENEGKYTITLTTVFADGTQKVISKEFTVVTALE